MSGLTEASLPRHVAIIMDGNGRWAGRRGMLRHLGHRAGIKPVKECVRFAAGQSIESLTLYAFSSENFQRPQSEVSSLMGLFLEALDKEVDELHEKNVQLRFVGNLAQLSTLLRNKIADAMSLTASNTGLQLNVAVAYGGRWDIINAVQSALAAGVELEKLDEKSLSTHLQLADSPEVDLLIRTGGEVRVSNFLLWQIAYSELYFTDTFWPDFNADEFAKALDCFSTRRRRRGKTDDQLRDLSC